MTAPPLVVEAAPYGGWHVKHVPSGAIANPTPGNSFTRKRDARVFCAWLLTLPVDWAANDDRKIYAMLMDALNTSDVIGAVRIKIKEIVS